MEKRASKLAWGIAYCLAYERGLAPPELERLRELVEADHMPQGTEGDVVASIAEAARLIVTPQDDQQERFQTKDALQRCRLVQLSERLNSPRVAVIMGGATKIKQYVFESAKLPEIRGASGLLDRINLRDIPALFAQEPDWLKQLRCRSEIDEGEIAEAQQLVKQVREWFYACYGVEPPDCKECIIYANGGEVFAFAPLKLAAFLAEAIECLYTRQTLIANSVAVWRSCSLLELRFGLRPLEFWADDFDAVANESLKDLLHDYYGESFFSRSRKTFGEVAAGLALEKLRRREGNRVDNRVPKPVPHLETVPYARRCQSCERRNAVVKRRFEGEEVGEWLCEPCARKRVFGQRAKKESPKQTGWFKDAGFSWEPLEAKAWSGTFDEWLEEHSVLKQAYYADARRAQAPDDLDDIAKASEPEDFIGVIYADGNNMGALLEELKTPADYQEFAEAVYQETMNATFTALATHLRPRRLHPKKDRWLHTFEVLSIGGDDVFLIVPAHVALPVAITIAQEAEKALSRYPITQQTKDYQWRRVHRIQMQNERGPAVQSKVSLSAGVVIAEQHTPIFFLRQLVEELLKSAKAKAKRLRDEDYYGATIDFLVLKSTGMIATNIRDFRGRVLKRNNLHLTAKPYTVPELRALLDAVKALKRADFPRSQLYRLREQLEKGWLASVVEYFYFQARLRHSEEVRKALEGVWTGTEQHGWPGNIGLWMRRENDEPDKYEYKFETVLGDLVEIYDFVPERGLQGVG
ncbi:MAG: type III-B CRISPR-associated protein Cas10/Cmr2 [Firmicutes bacterium]|nr:type III-B CRISPR-associated protein Cas10/Cmr2 [Bacillota bacterium]